MMHTLGVGLILLLVIAGAQAGAATGGADVTMDADDGSFPESYDVVDRLEADTVLRMSVSGFDPFTRAVAEQCTPHGSSHCENQIPVQFDADGDTRFQYLVTDEFHATPRAPGRCRADGAPCTLVVRAIEGATRAEIQTIFIDTAPPPGRIEVTPSRGISPDGESVIVEVHGYPAGATVTAMVCVAPDAAGRRCGKPGASAPMAIARDGTGRTKLFIESGPVGSQRFPCSRGHDCGISVASDEVFARAPVVPISFAGPTGAAYDAARLALGLGLAAALVAIAAWLIRRTDWSAVGEAAAPEISDAEYADLDAIIAGLPGEEDEVVSSR